MKGTVLITGGAGFIGSHVAAELVRSGYHVKVLDSLVTQVHGDDPARPAYLHRDAELVLGDVRNPDVLDEVLAVVDAVYHFVALVGVGQSMYQIAEYTSVNNLGTALLLERLVWSVSVEKSQSNRRYSVGPPNHETHLLLIELGKGIYGSERRLLCLGCGRRGQGRPICRLHFPLVSFELLSRTKCVTHRSSILGKI